MSWFVYMAQCSDGTLYTGCTNHVDKRIAKHNSGKGAKYTSRRLPVHLVYSTPVANRSEAQKLEYRIKQLSRAEKQKLIRGGK